MLNRLMLTIAAIAMIVSGTPLPPASASAAPPEAKGRIRAVIVAVAAYREDIALPLLGTYNDAVLIGETLIRSGAKREDITILADKPSAELLEKKGNPRLRATSLQIDALATRDNILGALKKAAIDTRPGDEVLLSFSGHGIQQVETVAGSEPDGRDEVFLPFDTGAPDTKGTKVENAILDDEIGAVIDAIRSKGGNVTFLADFCHSGDSQRDAAAPPPEPIEAKLKLPERKYVAVSDAGFVRDLAGETKKGQAGWGAYVGMMAAPSAVQARQALAPAFADRSEQAPHGLLTVYAMANWNNPRVYSYRDLANRITAGTDKHKKAPRPEFDGDIDRPLMGGLMKSAAAAGAGAGSWAVFKPATVVAKSTDPARIETLEMSAGQLQGVIEGTIVGLALAGPAGDKTILYGRVDKADAYKAILVPATFGDIPAERWTDVRDIDGKPLTRAVRLIATIEQQPVQLDYRIALPAAPASPTPAQKAALAALTAIKPADIGATFVPAGQDADLVLGFDKDKPDLLILRQPPGRITASFGDLDLAAVMAAGGGAPDVRMRFTIGGALVKATRFSRLQRVLASPAMATGEPGEDPAKAVQVEFYVGRPKALTAGACPDTSADYYAVDKDARKVGGDGSEAGSFTFQRCDWLFIKITNGGESDVYVNPLIFSPDGGILLFDGQDGRLGIKKDNPTRLRAGESGVLQYSLSDAQQGAQLRDDFVLLVSDVTDGVPLSYARLTQCPVVPGPEDGAACAVAAGPSLAGTRMRNNGAGGTAIEELIDAALVGSTTRSGPVKKPTAVSALRFSWQTEAR